MFYRGFCWEARFIFHEWSGVHKDILWNLNGLEVLQNTIMWLVAWPNDSVWVDLVASCETYWNLLKLPPQVESHSNVHMGVWFCVISCPFWCKIVSLLTTHGISAKPGDFMLATTQLWVWNDSVGVPLGEHGEESGWDPCLSAPPPSYVLVEGAGMPKRVSSYNSKLRMVNLWSTCHSKYLRSQNAFFCHDHWIIFMRSQSKFICNL